MTIDQYILSAPDASQKIMEELKELIETLVPEAEGDISWNVPIYKYNGILAGFDVAKRHVSFGIDSLKEKDRSCSLTLARACLSRQAGILLVPKEAGPYTYFI